MIPPPPIPCTVLPAKRSVKFCANPAISMPTRNNITDRVVIHLRPKTLDKAAIVGWKTVDVSRYEVAAQNASSPVPCRAFAMIYKSQLFFLVTVAKYFSPATRLRER